MTKVVAIMSMSLDGYVADANDGVAEVFDWYFSGDVEVSMPVPTSDMTFRVSAPSADHVRGLMAEVGAMLTGRRTFEVAGGWDGQHPWDVPAFVVTHRVPDGWPRPGSTVEFVTDGIGSAVARARSAAGQKSVGVHGAHTIQGPAVRSWRPRLSAAARPARYPWRERRFRRPAARRRTRSGPERLPGAPRPRGRPHQRCKRRTATPVTLVRRCALAISLPHRGGTIRPIPLPSPPMCSGPDVPTVLAGGRSPVG